MKRKNVLVISPIPSHPRNAGHRERIYQLLQNIQQLGHDVHFLYITQEKGDIEVMQAYWGDKLSIFAYDIDRTRNRCSPSFHATFAGRTIRKFFFALGREYNFPYSIDDWYDQAFEEFLRGMLKQTVVDIVMMEYIFFSKALDIFDESVLKIIDTIDMFSNRHKLYQQYQQKPLWFYTTRRDEKKGLKRADVVLAIQEQEQQFFARLVPEKKVITLSHLVQLCHLSQKSDDRNTILFLASDNPINIHGMNYFLTDVFPLIQSKIKNIQFLVAGSICRVIDERREYTKIGEINDTKAVYEMADVIVNPVLFGTGIKIKNLEALGYAKPLVTTPEGAIGLDDEADGAFFRAATPEEFANRVIELLVNDNLRSQMAERAYQYAMILNEKNVKTLESILQLDKKEIQV